MSRATADEMGRWTRTMTSMLTGSRSRGPISIMEQRSGDDRRDEYDPDRLPRWVPRLLGFLTAAILALGGLVGAGASWYVTRNEDRLDRLEQAISTQAVMREQIDGLSSDVATIKSEVKDIGKDLATLVGRRSGSGSGGGGRERPR